MKAQLIYFAISLILFGTLNGCKQTTKERVLYTDQAIDTTCININIDPLQEELMFPFDSLITDISYIKLETTDECLIGDIYQIIYQDPYLFIMDRWSANSVYCFDKKGKFVRRIGNIGQGPGEYPRLNRMSLSSDKKSIIIYDWALLHYYDLEGNHIKDEKMETVCEDVEFMTNSTVIYDSSGRLSPQRSMVGVYDSDKKLVYSDFPSFKSETFKSDRGFLPLQKFGGDLYYNNTWTEDIYRIMPDGYYKAYHVDIAGGGYQPITEGMDDDTYSAMNSKRITLHKYVIFPEHSLFFLRCNGLNWSPFAIYSNKTEKTYLCSTGNSCNQLSQAEWIFNVPPVMYNDNTFLVPQSATTVMSWKKHIYDGPVIVSPTISNLYDNLTEESNPILFLLKINDKL